VIVVEDDPPEKVEETDKLIEGDNLKF